MMDEIRYEGTVCNTRDTAESWYVCTCVLMFWSERLLQAECAPKLFRTVRAMQGKCFVAVPTCLLTGHLFPSGPIPPTVLQGFLPRWCARERHLHFSRERHRIGRFVPVSNVVWIMASKSILYSRLSMSTRRHLRPAATAWFSLEETLGPNSAQSPACLPTPNHCEFGTTTELSMFSIVRISPSVVTPPEWHQIFHARPRFTLSLPHSPAVFRATYTAPSVGVCPTNTDPAGKASPRLMGAHRTTASLGAKRISPDCVDPLWWHQMFHTLSLSAFNLPFSPVGLRATYTSPSSAWTCGKF